MNCTNVDCGLCSNGLKEEDELNFPPNQIKNIFSHFNISSPLILEKGHASFCTKCGIMLQELCGLDEDLKILQKKVSKVVANITLTVMTSKLENKSKKGSKRKQTSEPEKSTKLGTIIYNTFSPKVALADYKDNPPPKKKIKKGSQGSTSTSTSLPSLSKAPDDDDDDDTDDPPFNLSILSPNKINEKFEKSQQQPPPPQPRLIAQKKQIPDLKVRKGAHDKTYVTPPLPTSKGIIDKTGQIGIANNIPGPSSSSTNAIDSCKLHFKMIDNGIYNCGLCDQKEKLQSNMIHHLVTTHHNPNHFNNQTGPIKMVAASRMITRTGLGIFRYGKWLFREDQNGTAKCNVCGFIMVTQADIYRHVRTHEVNIASHVATKASVHLTGEVVPSPQAQQQQLQQHLLLQLQQQQQQLQPQQRQQLLLQQQQLHQHNLFLAHQRKLVVESNESITQFLNSLLD